MTTHASVRCNVLALLDRIQMSNGDRNLARACLRQGVFIAKVIVRTFDLVRSIGTRAERRLRWILRVTD